MGNKEDEYIDCSLVEKGITVIYRDSQYKRKIWLIVNMVQLLDGSEPNPCRIVRKLNKHIGEYFGFKYQINDFCLSGMRLVADIDVNNCENVAEYLKVLKRIGRVKGFASLDYECFDDIGSFCLDGNSNSIEYLIYDLKDYITQQLKEANIERKKLKSIRK